MLSLRKNVDFHLLFGPEPVGFPLVLGVW